MGVTWKCQPGKEKWNLWYILTWTGRHLSKHLRYLAILLHIYNLLLLVPLLRSLMCHHLCAIRSRAGKAVNAGRPWHLARIVRKRRAGSWRVHLHLRVRRHAHEGAVRRLLGHHVSAHGRARWAYKLRSSLLKRNMWNIGAHPVPLHGLLWWENRKPLGLSIVHVGMRRTGRRMHR